MHYSSRYVLMDAGTPTQKATSYFLVSQAARLASGFPRPLNVTAHRIGADDRLQSFRLCRASRRANTPRRYRRSSSFKQRGCWQISANYKADNLSFVVWVD